MMDTTERITYDCVGCEETLHGLTAAAVIVVDGSVWCSPECRYARTVRADTVAPGDRFAAGGLVVGVTSGGQGVVFRLAGGGVLTARYNDDVRIVRDHPTR